MNGAEGDHILLDMAGARLVSALDEGDVIAVMNAAAELEGLVRRLGPKALDEPALRPALQASAGLVARVLERLADAQEAALAARMRDRRVQTAYGVTL